jgi:hypothetical protein
MTPSVVHPGRCRSAGGADVTTGGGSSHALVAKLARSPRAAYRWQLVRALVRFQVSCWGRCGCAVEVSGL